MLLVSPSWAAMHHETPDAHLTIFEDLGEMIPNTAYIHVLVPVDMRNFSKIFSTARQLLKSTIYEFQASEAFNNAKYYDDDFHRITYLTLHPEANATHTRDAGISIMHQILQLQRVFTNITAMLPKQSASSTHVLSRQKRVIPFIVAGIGIAVAAIIGAIVGNMYLQWLR